MIATTPSGSKQNSGLGFQETILPILIRIFVYCSALYFFSFVTADTDLWGHIIFGKDLWAIKAFQRIDLYSFTALGSEWVNHEWLSELMMAMVYRTFGSPGLLIGKLLVGLSIVYLISKICFHRANSPLVYGIIMVLSVFVMSPGFMIRPQLLTFLFVAYFLYAFHIYLERGKNLLWTLPIIMVVWVNCHGGFLIGLGMFPVVVACEFVTCRLRKRDTRHLRSMLLWFIITEVSVFVNPYGYRLLGFLYETLSVPRGISEWDPVTIPDLSYFRFKLLALLFFVSFFFRNRERRYWEAGIIIIALIYAFMHERHTPIFAVVAAAYLIENISLMARRTGVFEKLRSFSSYAILNAFIFILIVYQLLFTGYKYVRAQGNIIVDPREYPVYAVRFLKENQIKGNILLPFEWGEYAIYKLYPDCRVSIDGRFRTVYPEEVLADHFEAACDEKKLKNLLDKYPADIILGRQNPLYQQLITTQDRYIYVYSDPTSIVFVRDGVFQEDILDSFRKKKLICPDSKALTYFP
jgi:hypothetical protein